MRWVIMGMLVGLALWLANWGHKRQRKLPARAPHAYWDGMEATKAADEFVRGLPRKGDDAVQG